VRNVGEEEYLREELFLLLRDDTLILVFLLDLQMTNSPPFIGSKGEF